MRKTVLRLMSCVLLPLLATAEETAEPSVPDFAVTNVLRITSALVSVSVIDFDTTINNYGRRPGVPT